MASYVGENLFLKKSAALLLLLLGIVLIVIGVYEDAWAVASLGTVCFLGGVFFLCLRLSRATVINCKAVRWRLGRSTQPLVTPGESHAKRGICRLPLRHRAKMIVCSRAASTNGLMPAVGP
jgi:hypothetical protein